MKLYRLRYFKPEHIVFPPLNSLKDSSLNINSSNIREVLAARDGEYLKHDKRVAKLQASEIVRCYANTIELRTKSSHFYEEGHPSKGKYYRQLILFEDFYTIAKDRQILFEEAIEYAIEFCDIHYYCDCPAFLYWGYKYIATQLDLIYGPYRENRAPTRNNTELRGLECKHATKALYTILANKSRIRSMFADYYRRLPNSIDFFSINQDLHEEPLTEEVDEDTIKVSSPDDTSLDDVSQATDNYNESETSQDNDTSQPDNSQDTDNNVDFSHILEEENSKERGQIMDSWQRSNI